MLEDQPAQPYRDRTLATAALIIATLMQAFDATIVNVALPRLEQSLGAGISQGSWVVTSYLCAAAVTAPMTGWARRKYGARNLLVAAIVLFASASLLCAAAGSTRQMIAFRLVQGFAAGGIQPLAQALLLDISPKREHGRMLAIWGAAVMIGPIVGPTLGGLITDFGSWRWIFAINLPLALIAIAGLRWLPRGIEAPRDVRIDAIGIFLLVLGIGALQLGLERSIGRNWLASPELWFEAAVAAAALGGMSLYSSKAQFRILRPEVFCDLSFALASFYNFVVSGLLFATIVLVPAIGEGSLGFAALVAGLTMSPRAIATMATMAALGYLIDKIDNRILLAVGMVMLGGALALMSGVPAERAAAAGWLAGAGLIQGVAAGLLFTPLSTLAFSTLPQALRTDGTGVYNLLRQLGSATGVTVMTAALTARMQVHLADVPAGNADSATFLAYTDCFRIMAIASIVTLPGILLFLRPRPGGEELVAISDPDAAVGELNRPEPAPPTAATPEPD